VRRIVTILAFIPGLALSAQAQQKPVVDTIPVLPARVDSLHQAPAVQPAPQFWKGWFGELDAKAGATAIFPAELDPLKKNRGFLFNGNAMVSAWSDKDQFTFVAGGNNTNEKSSELSESDSGPDTTGQGLTTAAQAGINYYTVRLKDMETAATLNYKFTNTDTGTNSELNEFQEEEFMSTSSNTSGNKRSHSVSLDGSLKRDKGNMLLNVKPVIRFVNSTAMNSSDSWTMSGQIVDIPDEEWQRWQEEEKQRKEEEERWWKEEMQHMQGQDMEHWQEEMMHRDQHPYERMTRRGWAYYSNNSTSNNNDVANDFTAQVNADMTLRQLAGKKGRDLRFTFNAGYDVGGGTRDESSELWTSSDHESRMMHYDISSNAARLGGAVSYTEPLAPAWTLTATADASWTGSNSLRDASDNNGRNDLFSSVSNANNIKQKYDVTSQYKFGPQSWVSFGGMLTGMLNETYSKSKGVEDTTGENDWYWFVTPTAKFQHVMGQDRFTASVSGNTQRPGTTQMLPVLDLRVPSRPGIGNIYLRPYSAANLNTGWSRSNKERSTTLNVSLGGSLNFNPIIYARWYDSKKVQYAVPVNSRKPGFTATLSANYSMPLDEDKYWTLTAAGSAKYNSSTSYQARSALPGIDKTSFDYSSFMASFWGDDESGKNFYDGTSGFDESITRMFQPSANVSVRFKRAGYDFLAGASTLGRISRYSLNPDINVNTADTRLYVSGAYASKGGLDVKSSFAYVFYAGYSEGFGLPELQWNAEASQKWGDFVFSFKAFDILNQTRNLTHSVTANYEEDTYRLNMGRYFLLGVKWCFGKADASHNQRARQAMKAMGL